MFSQLWDYKRDVWAGRFFERWKSALRWQRLKPHEKFARRIEDHCDGIASYCHEKNKVPLGFVEGINNKIRVIQRRAYGLRDEEYLRLKILTCMLPEIYKLEPTRRYNGATPKSGDNPRHISCWPDLPPEPAPVKSE